MSDAVTNVEIEDILSSIRRLVSEDAGAAKPAPVPPRETKRVERLVLTPALRVQEPEPKPSPEPVLLTNPAVPSQPEQAAELQPETEADLSIVDAPVEPTTAIDLGETAEADIEAETAEISLLAQLVEEEVSRALEDTSLDQEDEVATASDLEDPEPADTMPPAHDEVLERKIAALEALVRGRAEPSDAPADIADDEEDGTEPVTLSIVEDRAAQPVFRHRSDDDLIEWEDDAPEAVVDTASAPDRPMIESDQAVEPKTVTEAPVLDEAVLRDMVSDIVRQELQGVLGERITRNVRKLVRREIHRVMMTQEFD
ncbi:hypothetical protein [Sagittula sp. SSi028]|uniref:hypothetical protein n=1 Tax=Sagittula sp. SSi028 TaxID=3400636 RepID=UPI003AF434C8